MNTITITTENIKPFELPKFQEWYLLIKSLVVFSEFNKVLGPSDEFIFIKDKHEVFILQHNSEKKGLTKSILAFSDINGVTQKQMHHFLYNSFKEAWAEYLF